MSAQHRSRTAMVALHFAEYALRLAEALQRQHTDVLFVTYADHANNELGVGWMARAQSLGLALLVLDRPRHPGQILRNAWRLWRAFARFDADLVHVQEALRDELVLALAIRPAVPMVLTVHDPAPHLGLDAERLHRRRRFYRHWLRTRAQLAITHGETLARALVAETPELRGRVRVAGHGPLGGPAASVPVPLDPIRLLFFGRVEAYKGLRHMVEAVGRLNSRGFPIQAVVAGRGSDLECHRAAMASAGCFVVHDRYIPAAEVPGLFTDCTAVVLPYIEGTQSGVAAMALGFGRAVVATRVGAIPEMVRDGVTGILVPPGDTDALEIAIAKAAADPAVFQRMGDAARQLAAGELGWDAIATATAGIYRSAQTPLTPSESSK